MNTKSQLNFTGRIRSFYSAFKGIKVMITSQHNAWIHTIATFIVIVAGLFFRLTAMEWCWIILSITVVWTAEALNTAFEFLTDVASPEFHPLAGKAKDVAAGGVLIVSIGSAIIGLIIFLPYILEMF